MGRPHGGTSRSGERRRAGRNPEMAEEMGEETRTEAVVWIEREGNTEVVRGGTRHEQETLELSSDLKAGINDPRRRIEIWHNHPKVGRYPGSAAPSAQDIRVAVAQGVSKLHTVGASGRYTGVQRANTDGTKGHEIEAWVEEARILEDERLERSENEAKDQEDALSRTAESAEAAAAAAEAIGVIKIEGVSERARDRARKLAEETQRGFRALRERRIAERQIDVEERGHRQKKPDATGASEGKPAWKLRQEAFRSWTPPSGGSQQPRTSSQEDTTRTTSRGSRKGTSRTR